jgi:nucleotide-binding universal stress UspA family protein
MSRILVAVSSPFAAERLGPAVVDLATRLAAEVLVVHVCRPSTGQMREQEQADGEASIAALRNLLHEAQLTVQTLLLFSDEISSALLAAAEERQCSLIALGLTGKNVFARLLAGNVPVEIIRATPIPVLLLPPTATAV